MRQITSEIFLKNVRHIWYIFYSYNPYNMFELYKLWVCITLFYKLLYFVLVNDKDVYIYTFSVQGLRILLIFYI